MRISIWGVRGSIPTPLNASNIESKIRSILALARPGDIASPNAIEQFMQTLPFSLAGTYGGNTTSIQLESSLGDQFIIDCGSGLRQLGIELMKGDFGKGRGTGHIFLTHTHWDHIQGIPFFVPLYIKGNLFNFYSSFPDIRERLNYQQAVTHFPVSLDYTQSIKEFVYLKPGRELYINDMLITSKQMPHPGTAYGFRFEERGKVFVYTSDCEFNINEIDRIRSYQEFFQDADVIIFDTQYTFEESFEKFEFGHSSAAIAIDIAGMFGVKRLVLFHHEPSYNDEKLDIVLANAKSYQIMNAKKASNLQIDIAYEGMIIDL